LWLAVGGLLLGLFVWSLNRFRARHLIDAVEANALHGGRLSIADSAVICVQTLISNGFGASVGLEAAYAQAGGAAGSALGRWLRLRRADLRTMLGAGAGAAIAGAFGAPLTGVFYAFEVIIGSYSPSAIAPVAAAALSSVVVTEQLGGAPYSIAIASQPTPDAYQFLLYGALGLICAFFGIALMMLVGFVERIVRASAVPTALRPVLGALLLMSLAVASPQVLSSGHGALSNDLAVGAGLAVVATLLVLKSAASIVSLGFGFRGGLFFASLFLGSLVGLFCSQLANMSGLPTPIPPENAALVGMGAMAVAVVGGPLTMSFLVLEVTRDLSVASGALAAALIASTIVRERFGFSFSTWRLHLRGETVRSARDVGWIRSLTAGKMMRTDLPTFSQQGTVKEFRRRFPLASASRVALLDEAQRYAGLVATAEIYREGLQGDDPVRLKSKFESVTLTPEMNIEEVMRAFDQTEADELAVVDNDGHVLGFLAEAYVARRYSRELEKMQQQLFGEE
jgi:CIC family chloride channel protein